MTEQEHPGGEGLPGVSYTGKKRVKMIFPVGIFFMLFFIESLIAAGASIAYFFYIGRGGIAEIESNTRSYAVPVAEAFGDIAEMCYRTKNFSRLRALFRGKIEQRLISEAFFVLRDGRVVAHSDPAVSDSLKGNLASDELAYNMDLILRPLDRKSREVFFGEYNIISKQAPFKREYRVLMKRYFYPGIDSTGWIASRAVFGKKKPVGAVCFIMGKDRIYSFLAAHINRSLGILLVALSVACGVSFMVTLVVMARYRSIQKKSLAASYGEVPSSGATAGEFYDMTMTPAAAGPADDDLPVIVELLREPESGAGGDAAAGSTPFHQKREIKDAISAEEKE
jgi:hypothetical protein